jgi:hypothetical protein
VWIISPIDSEAIPERERRCIFEDVFVGDDFGAAMALSDGVADDIARCYERFYSPCQDGSCAITIQLFRLKQREGQ